MEFIMILSAIAMFLLMLLRRGRYNISLLKTVLIVFLVAVLGVLSTCLLYFIENGEWGGKSFFGAVLFLPVIFSALSRVFKVEVSVMMDFIAPPGLLMFAVMKANCTVSGCCSGRLLGYTAGRAIYFPSPTVEALTTLLLVGILLFFEYRGKTENLLYPISLVSYGILRFVLNFFRLPEEPFLLGLQKGSVWSLIAVIGGLTWILISKYIEIDKKYKEFKNSDCV